VPSLAGATVRQLRVLPHGASQGWVPGDRLFLQHGPINLVVKAWGEGQSVDEAYAQLIDVFPDWLGGLVDELPRLRMTEPCSVGPPEGEIARRMVSAVAACKAVGISPMAAVAGAVADQACRCLAAFDGVHKAYVNNGGDISVHLGPGQRLLVGLVPDLEAALLQGEIELPASSVVRGVATSGWQGRSHSLGIADAVTVLATDAVRADAAATSIGNAVDVPFDGIGRVPARDLDADSELGERLVTVAVPYLPHELRAEALAAGVAEAVRLRSERVIQSAALSLQGAWRLTGSEGLWSPGVPLAEPAA